MPARTTFDEFETRIPKLLVFVTVNPRISTQLRPETTKPFVFPVTTTDAPVAARKTTGADGLAYKDAAATDSGVVKIAAKGGAAGKGKLSLAARNKASKGQTALPALAGGLAGAASATVQVVASDGACFELLLGNVKQGESDRFLGSGP